MHALVYCKLIFLVGFPNHKWCFFISMSKNVKKSPRLLDCVVRVPETLKCCHHLRSNLPSFKPIIHDREYILSNLSLRMFGVKTANCTKHFAAPAAVHKMHVCATYMLKRWIFLKIHALEMEIVSGYRLSPILQCYPWSSPEFHKEPLASYLFGCRRIFSSPFANIIVAQLTNFSRILLATIC